MRLYRKYLGGSKKNEMEIFDEVYYKIINGIDDINWIKYKKNFIKFSIDLVIVLKNRIKLTSLLYKILLLLALVPLFIIPMISMILIFLSLIFYLYNYFLNKTLTKIEMLNNITINAINLEIHKQYNYYG